MALNQYHAFRSAVIAEAVQFLQNKGVLSEEIQEGLLEFQKLFGLETSETTNKKGKRVATEKMKRLNGYRLFIQETPDEDTMEYANETDKNGKPLKPLPRKSKMWKALSEEERQSYNQRADSMTTSGESTKEEIIQDEKTSSHSQRESSSQETTSSGKSKKKQSTSKADSAPAQKKKETKKSTTITQKRLKQAGLEEEENEISHSSSAEDDQNEDANSEYSDMM
jgi:hypothetical protein